MSSSIPIRDIDRHLWPIPCRLVVLRGSAILGFLSRSVEGWRYQPHTSSHRPSRKCHALARQACGRAVNGSETIATTEAAIAAGILRGDRAP